MSTMRIIYKSGAEVTVKGEITVVRNALGELTRIKWDEPLNPHPLFLGVDDIAAIWKTK